MVSLAAHTQAPTPVLIGIYSNTFTAHQIDVSNVLIAHLDFDRVLTRPLTHTQITYPEGYAPTPLDLPFLDQFSLSSPLDCPSFPSNSRSDHIYWTDRPNSKVATSCLFSVTAGPGRLGLRLEQEPRQLVYSEPGSTAVLEEVVYIESEESKKLGGVIGGHIDDCMLLGQNPAILEINGTCWIGGLGA